MDKKIKVLLVCLGMVSLFTAGIAAWIYLSAQTELAKSTKIQSDFKKQSASLREEIDASQKEIQHWRDRSTSITASLTQLGKQHAQLQNQYQELVKEKDSLLEKNKFLSGQVERLDKLYSEARQKPKVGKSDTFLASLLEEKAALEVEMEKLKKQLVTQERYVQDIESQRRPVEEKIELLQKERENLERKFQDAQKISKTLSKDLLEEKKKTVSLQEGLTEKEKNLEETLREKDKISEQLANMKQALESRLAELTQTKQVLENALKEAKEVAAKQKVAAIQLPPIVVKAQGQLQEPSLPRQISKARVIEAETFELIGRIIRVNDKHKFVIIDIGRDDGVELGMSFNVYRRDRKIGRVEVIETRKEIAACDIKQTDVQKIKVDDSVRR